MLIGLIAALYFGSYAAMSVASTLFAASESP